MQNGALSGTPGTFVQSLIVEQANQNDAGIGYGLRLYREDGTLAYQSATWLPFDSVFYLPLQVQPRLPDGRYAGVITAQVGVIAQANLLAQGPSMAASYRALSPTETARSVLLPNVFKNYAGYTSVLSVQNTTDAPAQVAITYRDQAGATVGTSPTQTIPGNGFVDVAQAAADLPDGFVGSASVVADQPIAATDVVYGAAGELSVVSGGTAGGPVVNLPVLYKNYSDDRWISSIRVQNRAPSAATIRLTLQGSGLNAPVVLTDTLPGLASRQYYQGNVPASLPDGFVGSAVVESLGGQPISALVNTRNARGHLGSYAGQSPTATPPSGSSRRMMIFGLYNDYSSLRWSSSFVLQNTSAADVVTVTIGYYDLGGFQPVATSTETLPPGQTRLHYLPNEGLPAGFRGKVVITWTGSDLVGVGNTLATGQSAGDWLLTAEGTIASP